jgi:hypothetical protein
MRSPPEPRFRPLGSLGVTITLQLCTMFFLTGSALGQVGHQPGSSPYHDIRRGHTFTAVAGYFSGDGGSFGIGPHSGAIIGGRYDIRTSRAIQLGIQATHGRLDRFIVNPFVRLANRRTGPVSQPVTFAEIALQFNVTGGKSWHGIAPFVGAAGGIAFAGSTAADTSRYTFGRKLYLAPNIGIRFFFSERLHLRAEARTTFWKLKYPTTFQAEPVEEPGTPESPNAVITGSSLAEWTSSSWLQAGLGYSFSP